MILPVRGVIFTKNLINPLSANVGLTPTSLAGLTGLTKRKTPLQPFLSANVGHARHLQRL